MMLLAPLWGELNHPEWEVRQRADSNHNMLSALLLSTDIDDPEIRIRATEIRNRLIIHITDVYQERKLLDTDPDKWLENHVVNGDSVLMTPEQIFIFIRTQNYPPGPYRHLLLRFREKYPTPFYSEGYLLGTICNGEWETWRVHLRHYDKRSRGHAVLMGGFWFATK